MTFAARLTAEIAAAPMPVATYMARCNAHYYATRDPFGEAGDFVTAPEISQLFGELIGAWLADQWLRAQSPRRSRLVELGPGRGTMMTDIRRAIRPAGWAPEIVFVETSPALAAGQLRAHPGALSVPSLEQVDDDAPLFLVANEFFDALPVRQFAHGPAGWRERFVAAVPDGFGPVLGPADATPFVPAALAQAPVGSVVEVSPASTAVAAEIGARLRTYGGAALIVDYGHAGPVTGDTLQAVRGHAPADPFADPGEADLTAHVDFTALAAVAGVRAWGPVGQGVFLRALGIEARAATLKRSASPAQGAALDAAVARLTDEAAMGSLFKVVALTVSAAAPPGFA